MNNFLKRSIIASLAAVTLLTGVITYYQKILYLRDCVIGFYIEVAEALFPSPGSFTIVDNQNYRRYLHTFRKLPPGFVYAGGILMYRTEKDDGLGSVSSEAVRFTEFFRASKLATEIREYNGIRGGELPSGATLVVPGALPALQPEIRNRALPAPLTARGLYFTGTSAGSNLILKNLDRYKKLGINTIVFDAKDVSGIVNYYSRLPEAREYGSHDKRSIDNIEKFIRTLKENGFYVIARIAVFHDHLLRKEAPKLAIRSRKNGGVWNPDSKEKWCDPTNKKVQDYNIGLAVELADLGVDEIQFDYIRFPTTGNLQDAGFRYDFGEMSHEAAITHFLKRTHQAISAHHARLSIDIFGVVAWGKGVDITSTGQRIEELAGHCDVISPMLYPSHFNDDFDGYANPGDNPYYFIYNGCKKVIELAGVKATVRPWLQAFRWRVSHYNSQYILTQIKATNDSGARGYLFWNASNDYETVLNALEDLNGAKPAKDEK